ncbi:GAF domain-containing protein [Chloroflexota bacterium]
MRSTKFQFTILTVLLGILFPIGATVLEVGFGRGLPFTFANFINAHNTTPVIWIVDTAPFFLGLYAFLAGSYMERFEKTASELEVQNQSTIELAEQLRQQNLSLEETVLVRTAAIDRRANYLEAAADVGRAATSIYNLDELLPQVTRFISERFDFYQVGIFLIDELGEYAELKAANSEGGKRMLARRHKLKVGQEGIVGYVTSTGEVRIALDVGDDAVHFDTPELPETRSEMALPLFTGGRLFGALDVQSTISNAFSDDDVVTLRVLADQVSMAINNAILFEQLQESLEAERRAYGEINRSAWRTLITANKSWGYRFQAGSLISSRGEWAPEMIQAAQTAHIIEDQDQERPTLALPITVSDEVIGAIRLTKPKDSIKWSEDEIDLMKTLTDRLSQALESARLYQETQRRAAQEQLTSEITTKIRQSLDIDHVLRTAVQEFGEIFDAEEVVFNIYPIEEQDQN